MLARSDFAGVIRNAVAGLGLPADIAMVDFPIATFLVESDISAVASRAAQFVDGLTRWRPATTGMPQGEAMLRIEGADFEEAQDRMNALFLECNWGDGLPVMAPTRRRVAWILEGTDLPPDNEIGLFMPRGGMVTVRTAAIALAMAGGRPEYLPVLLAAVEAILDPDQGHELWQSTSCSTFPAVIVNGPVAPAIRLNCGFGLMGPDPRHPAGASIGRAIRLLQQNAGGALPGVGTMAQYGGMRYTNAVFAEDEEGLPAGWEPFSVEYLGHAPQQNVASVAVVSGISNVFRRGRGRETLEEEAVNSLHRIASYMRSHNANSYHAYLHGTPGVLILSRTIAQQLAALGWTKQSIREFLWEHSRIPLEELKRAGSVQWIEEYGDAGGSLQERWPINSQADNLAIVVAGGTHPTHAYWMQTAFVSGVASAPVVLPARWAALLQGGEPGPARPATGDLQS